MWNPTDKLKVRWNSVGVLINDGMVYRREKGDEDIVEYGEHGGLIDSGKLTVLGDAENETQKIGYDDYESELEAELPDYFSES
jgi:hypothetical protein